MPLLWRNSARHYSQTERWVAGLAQLPAAKGVDSISVKGAKQAMGRNGRRVVVTGMGLVCPLGNDVESAWQAMRAGRSGIRRLTHFDPSHIDTHIAGEVDDFDAEALLGRREARRTDRFSQFAIAAGQQALADAGYQITDGNRYDIGCVVGTGVGGIGTFYLGIRRFLARGQRGVSPMMVPMMLPDAAAGRVSIEFGIRGPNWSINTACATGNNCIGDAADLIRHGRLNVMLAGGTEASLQDICIVGFANMTALSKRNDEPERASRPFDAQRDGFVVAEGSGMLLLEEREHALARGAKIHAEVLGYGSTSDAHHITAPSEDGESAAQAVRLALADAGLSAADIDYINAHGTSTPLNDTSETNALKRALGETAYQIPISSTKSMTGHMLGAAGSAEAIFSIMALRDNFAPPTINYEYPDPTCDLDYTANEGAAHEIQRVMTNSFGFGGHNAVLILGRHDG